MSRVDAAFQQVDRRDFLPASEREYAAYDQPLPIGFGQTNSQPSTVRQMLEWLDVQEGMKVLDVGSGSGWTSALLAQLAGKRGSVYAVELVPELVTMTEHNCKRAGAINVLCFHAGEELGLPQHAPYDRILVSASASEFPNALVAQLKYPGKMVVPVGVVVYEVERDASGVVTQTPHSGYLFVPLMGS